MLSPRNIKVLRDLKSNVARTLLVVLSIAIGVFAIGTIAGAQSVLELNLADAYQAGAPANVTLYLQPFDQDLVDVVRRMQGVGYAEARHTLAVRVQVGPQEWRDLQLLAVPDFADMRINRLRHLSGDWPPAKAGVLIERASVDFLGAHTGSTIAIQMPDGRERDLRVAGTVYQPGKLPSILSGTAYGYITFETLAWLGQPTDYDELDILTVPGNLDQDAAARIGEAIRTQVEKSGRSVFFVEVPVPGQHPADQFLQPMLLLLGVLGLLSLLASAFLVFNVIAALLTRQVREIGALKACGGHTSQMVGMYLSFIIILCVLALGVAVPLGVAGAYGLSILVAQLVNLDIATFTIPPRVFLMEIGLGLLIPIAAGLYPILAGARITVREAINSYGLSREGVGNRGVNWFFGHMLNLYRPVLLALRNTFRRQGRLIVTLVTLTLSGMIFIAVASVHASLMQTLQDALKYWNYDIGVSFDRSYRIEKIEAAAYQVPNVAAVECWGMSPTRRLRVDGTASKELLLVAPGAETKMLQPVLLQGRWLDSQDENALVINTDLLKEEPDLGVGQEVVLELNGHKTPWRIVGVVQGVMSGATAYANYPHFARVAGDTGRASGTQVTTTQHDPEFQAHVSKALEDRFRIDGINVLGAETVSDVRQRVRQQFDLIVIFLLVMALLLVAVGGLGLMGTMSLNVLERTREIGVLRAIGASDSSLTLIILSEGLTIGALSWLAAVAAAVPLSMLLSQAVGGLLLGSALSYTYSLAGAVAWLVVVILTASLASAGPARRACKLTVREVLAYE